MVGGAKAPSYIYKVRLIIKNKGYDFKCRLFNSKVR